MPVVEPWREERYGAGKFWIFLISIPIMLISCLTFLGQKVTDSYNNWRLPELQNGTYVLPEYPADPYIVNGNAVDRFMITFTDVVVTDDAVRINAVATNITVGAQTLNCLRYDGVRQWTLPSVLFSSGNDRDRYGPSWCEGADKKVTVKRHGKAKVYAEFDRDKRFTEKFVMRWGECLAQKKDRCSRFTTEHTIDLNTAQKT
ncbi:hypothetical protein [Actinoplanes sp. HUAS TT8]|uniref:hypothetical protein n=1 Tax=Actinoplanes sp. HUAS TT8 TaxID=3447453 RepID=UPI003F51EA9F